MPSFAAFESGAHDLASAARRLLVGADGVAIGFLATVGANGLPHLSPVCPVFSGDDLYLVATARSPKTADLRATGAFVLHARLGANDEELQLAGRALEVADAAERATVHASIRFASFERSDPIFRLGIERALHVYWEHAGQPGTKPVRRRWRA